MLLVFEYDGKSTPWIFEHALLPAAKTFELDIAEAQQLDVHICCKMTEQNVFEFDTFKTFTFKNKKDRVLRVTVTVNMQHVPNINVKTIGPIKVTRPMSSKVCLNIANESNYNYRIIDQNRVSNNYAFPTLAKMIADIKQRVPAESVGLVNHLHDSLISVRGAIKCRNWLLNSGYTSCKHMFGTEESLWSSILFGYSVEVAEGECVAIWITDVCYCIFKRSGDSFRFLNLFDYEEALSMILKYDVKTVISCPSFDDAIEMRHFGDRNVICGIKDSIWNRYPNFYNRSINAHGDFGKYTIQRFDDVVIDVNFGNVRMSMETGTVILPFEWTTELNVGDAEELEVTTYFRHGAMVDTQRVIPLRDIGNSKIALTFAIEKQFDIKVSCAPLPPGRSPRRISFCVLIERTAIGFRKTVYFRDSGKIVIDNYTNLFAAFEHFKLANQAAVIFNASGSTVAEREEWRQAAEEHEFRVIQFVNGPVITLNSILFGRKPSEFEGSKTVLVTDMTAVDRKGQKSPLTYVLQTSQKKLKLKKITMAKIDKVYSSLGSVDHVFVAVEDISKPPTLPAHLNPVFLQASSEMVSKYMFSRVYTVPEAEPIIEDVAGMVFVAEWNETCSPINTEWQSVPFSRDVTFHVGETKILKIETAHYHAKQSELLKGFSFKTLFDRVVVLNIAVDAKLVPSVKHVRSVPLPPTVFEFTTDNHVIVRSNAIDELEYPAYVSFVDDNVIVGEGALAQQQRHPDRVVYDIFRMLSSDFDPDHPDPSWAFKTTHGDRDDVVVYMGDACTTATVCFGTIVNAIKKKVEEHTNHDLTDIGIKLPAGSFVSEDAKNGIKGMIGATLVVFN